MGQNAAEQLASVDPNDELTSVRGVAKEWLAGVTTLFGLFSFTGIFFAGDAVADLTGIPLALFIFFAAVGVLAAATSITIGTKAAHGWPEKPKLGSESWKSGRERGTTSDRAAERVDFARKDLKRAVIAAGITLGAVIGAIGVLWYDQAQPSPAGTTVRLVDADGRTIVCGDVQSIDASGVEMLKDDDDPYPWSAIADIEGADCPDGG